MAKRYDTAFIKRFIEERRDKIDHVICGMAEDWNWTRNTVYSNGEFERKYDWNSKAIEVNGITGSFWATPIMMVVYNNGSANSVHCWYEEDDGTTSQEIEEMKWLAKVTGMKQYTGDAK